MKTCFKKNGTSSYITEPTDVKYSDIHKIKTVKLDSKTDVIIRIPYDTMLSDKGNIIVVDGAQAVLNIYYSTYNKSINTRFILSGQTQVVSKDWSDTRFSLRIRCNGQWHLVSIMCTDTFFAEAANPMA